MSDTSTPQGTQLPAQHHMDDDSYSNLPSAEVLAEVQGYFGILTDEEVASRLREMEEGEKEREQKARDLEALKWLYRTGDGPEFIRLLGELTQAEHKKDDEQLMERYAQFDASLPPVISMPEVTPIPVPEPKFGAVREARKPVIDLLNPETKLGRFVSMVLLGEKPPSPRRNRISRQDYVSKLAGGALPAGSISLKNLREL